MPVAYGKPSPALYSVMTSTWETSCCMWSTTVTLSASPAGMRLRHSTSAAPSTAWASSCLLWIRSKQNCSSTFQKAVNQTWLTGDCFRPTHSMHIPDHLCSEHYWECPGPSSPRDSSPSSSLSLGASSHPRLFADLSLSASVPALPWHLHLASPHTHINLKSLQ